MLVVQEDPTLRALLAEAVEQAGAEVVTRSTAPAGVMALRERRYACLIVDTQLPGGSGLDLLRHSRGLSPAPDAFIVSGEPTMEHVLEALRLGALDFIAKPFAVSAIMNRVRLVLDRFQLAEQQSRSQLLLGAGGVYRELLTATATHKEEPEMAAIAATWAMRLLPAEGASVARVESDELVHTVAIGVSAAQSGLRVPLDRSFAGHILRRGRAGFFAPDRGPAGLELREWRGAGSGLVAPIVLRGRAVGTLAVLSGRSGAFNRSHLRILVGLARFLSLNLTVAQANELRRRFTHHLIAAQETDRAHIARELHDETAQALTAVLVRLKSLENDARDPQARQHLSELRLLVAKTLEDVGRLARGLRPAALDRMEFETVVRSHAYAFAQANGLELDMHVNGFATAPGLAPEAELALYRIVQEALTNVARHSKARAVSLVLQRNDQSVRVIVEDDGIGFDPSRTHGGMGLSGIRERVELFNGRLMIESEPGQGATLIVELPMEAVRHVEDPPAHR